MPRATLATTRALSCANAPAGFLQYAYDIGRYDHLNFAIILLAFAAFHSGRYPLTGLLLGLGLLHHEAILFYAAPGFAAAAIAARKSTAQILWVAVPSMILALALAISGDISAEAGALLNDQITTGLNAFDRGVFEYQLWLPWHQYDLRVLLPVSAGVSGRPLPRQ